MPRVYTMTHESVHAENWRDRMAARKRFLVCRMEKDKTMADATAFSFVEKIDIFITHT